MCSIMGIAGKDVTAEQFKECFLETTSRGPDAEKVLDLEKGILGFQRIQGSGRI